LHKQDQAGAALFGNRKCANEGNKIKAPNMFHRNMNASIIPMSAWNLIGENIHVATAIASVTPVNITTRPVNCNA
jgi:hypothetical protein